MSAYDPSEMDVRKEQERPKKAISVGKLSDLSRADLGASKTVAVATDPASAPMEDVPPAADASTQTAKAGGGPHTHAHAHSAKEGAAECGCC